MYFFLRRLFMTLRLTLALVLHVGSYTVLVFVSKLVMLQGFHFVWTLTLFQFIGTYVCMCLCRLFGIIEDTRFPYKDNVAIGAAGVASVAFMNFSLYLNSVEFYQVSRLLSIPCQMIVHSQMWGSRFSQKAKFSVALIVIGAGVFTVQSPYTNASGMIYALTSVVTTVFFSMVLKIRQREFHMNRLQCLFSVAPAQIFLTLTFVCIFEVVGYKSILWHEFSSQEIALIVLSCAANGAVVVSNFLVSDKFSQTSVQVSSHARTILGLSGGFIVFPNDTNVFQYSAGGILLLLLGVVSYSIFNKAQLDDDRQAVSRRSSSDMDIIPPEEWGGRRESLSDDIFYDSVPTSLDSPTAKSSNSRVKNCLGLTTVSHLDEE